MHYDSSVPIHLRHERPDMISLTKLGDNGVALTIWSSQATKQASGHAVS
jgi:hypothetical protein